MLRIIFTNLPKHIVRFAILLALLTSSRIAMITPSQEGEEMSIDRRNRIQFEELADLYNEVRPGYPDELVDDVLALSALPSDGNILEIGCGPGNATLAFARRGYSILAIELGERLASLAASNCRDYPGVVILNSSFEEWALQEAAFDLAISADAFHWIPPEIGYPKVARALKASGSLAFFWNVHVDPLTDWSRAIEKVYQAVAPGLDNPDRGLSADWLKGVIVENISNSGAFGDVTVRQYRGWITLTTERYLKLLRTYSGHRGLDEAIREKLYAGIKGVIEQNGGQVIRPQLTVLFHARRK